METSNTYARGLLEGIVSCIHEHACEGIAVKDLAPVVPLSPRVLESRLAEVVGRTPHAEIQRIRLNQVKTLFRASGLTMEQIAGWTGFAHADHLSAVFRKEDGMPPH